MGQWVKSLPAMQETQEMLVQSLGLEDSPEEEMAIHSSILAWKIQWTGLRRVGQDWVTQGTKKKKKKLDQWREEENRRMNLGE